MLTPAAQSPPGHHSHLASRGKEHKLNKNPLCTLPQCCPGCPLQSRGSCTAGVPGCCNSHWGTAGAAPSPCCASGSCRDRHQGSPSPGTRGWASSGYGWASSGYLLPLSSVPLKARGRHSCTFTADQAVPSKHHTAGFKFLNCGGN